MTPGDAHLFFPLIYRKRVKSVVIEYFFFLSSRLKKICQEKFDKNWTESEMSQDSYPNIKTKSVLFLPYASQDKDFKKSDSRIFLSQKKILQGKMVRSWTLKMQLVHFVPVLSSSLS